MLRVLTSVDQVLLDGRPGGRPVRVVSAGLAAALLLGVSAAAATGAPARSSAAPAAATRASDRPAALRLSAQVQPSPVAVPTARVPAPKAVASRRTAARRVAPARPRPVQRWLPTGTGMWVHEFDRTQGGNARAVVRTAQHAHLSTLYVHTGSSGTGWIGSGTLLSLLPVTRGTGIRVVAWDFPTLADPVADAHRMAKAAAYRCRGCARVAAVAPDVETAAEGTRISTATVTRYYRTLRALLPKDVAILATVPWPSEHRVGRYPYAPTAALVDALMPMAYWYNRSPAAVTGTSMHYLARFHRPLIPIGQGFDGRLDAPYLKADPHPGRSVQAFLLAAHRGGARGVSLWSWQTTGGQQWRALVAAHRLFPAR